MLDRFPQTRYQGSKQKLLSWIWSQIEHLEFDSVLDLFSGTAAVAYLMKARGKQVTTNDLLRFNQVIARALIVNDQVTMSPDSASALLAAEAPTSRRFISETFTGLFFTDEENAWLDRVTQNIHALELPEERDLCCFALFQAALAKRPYNLFHRANLYMRLAEVERGFGNKASWDRPFKDHFHTHLARANAAVFSNGRRHRALCGDCLSVPSHHDLVYIDPPYINSRGVGVDYLDFYHFLEGLTEYDRWPARITRRYKHRPYCKRPSPWTDAAEITGAFDRLLERYRNAIIVISYRSDGVPTIEELVALLDRHGRRDARQSTREYKYVLSAHRGKEALLVSEP